MRSKLGETFAGQQSKFGDKFADKRKEQEK